MTAMTRHFSATDSHGRIVRIEQRGHLVPTAPRGASSASGSFGPITYHLEDGTQLGIAGRKKWENLETGELYTAS